MAENKGCQPNDMEGVSTFPLLSQKQFASSSTGSMELVGVRERKPVKVSDLESQYRQPEEKLTLKEMVKEYVAKKAAKFSIKQTLTSNFPIVLALKHYQPLNDLPSDFIAGLTSGIMMISQGLAFASLSTLQPIVGLYISFFASLTYVFLGTGRQLSFGCIAILSIMMGSILDRYETRLSQSLGSLTCESVLTTNLSPLLDNTTAVVFNQTTTTENGMVLNTTLPVTLSTPDCADPFDIETKKLRLAGGVTMLCGILFVILGKIGLGKVTVIMSDSLVTGVTIGAAFHVGSSQLKTIFGLGFLPRHSGMFNLIKLWVSVLVNIHRSNLATIITAFICILLVYLVKRFVNEKYKERLRVPVPIDMIMMILATLVTYYAGLNENFNVGIIKKVPLGLPRPHIPDVGPGMEYFFDGLIIIIVAFTQTVSIAKLMGLKHNYKVDSNQEMFAVGMLNIVCSLFSGYISGASISRTAVQDSAGGRTQVASLFAALLVLLVMLFMGPYFYYVPKCALSAIVIVSLRSLMLKLLTIPDLWRKSKVDCLVLIITVTAVVILSPDIGLLIGVMSSIFLVLFQCMRSLVHVTVHIPLENMHVWRSKDKYFGEEETADIKVIRINHPLYFVNAEITTNAVFKKTGLNPLKLKMKKSVDVNFVDPGLKESQTPEAVKILGKNPGNNTALVSDNKIVSDQRFDTEAGSSHEHSEPNSRVPVNSIIALPSDTFTFESHSNSGHLPFTNLILDLSGVSFIDLMGVKALEFLIAKYKSVDVSVFITNVCENSLDTLLKSGFMTKHKEVVFLTIENVFEELTQNQK